MATLRSHGVMLVDSIPTHTPTAEQAKLARLEDTLTLYYYNGTAWVTIDLDALASVSLDGNDTPIVRGDAVTGVSPTAGEVATPIAGDTASVFLTDGQLEKWVHNGTTWSLAYTLAANEAANLAIANQTATTLDVTSSSGTDATIPAATTTLAGLMTAALFDNLANVITLTGIAADSTDYGTGFTGTTIPDGSNIQEALQALETALEGITAPFQSVTDTNSVDLTLTGTALSADVKRSATQDNEFAITESADGLRVTKQTLTAYVSHAAATADAGLTSGSAYILSAANIDGVPSDGTSGPVFRKA